MIIRSKFSQLQTQVFQESVEAHAIYITAQKALDAAGKATVSAAVQTNLMTEEEIHKRHLKN